MSALRILFIDDDLGVLKTAELLLQKAGYDFRGAQSPSEAYSFLATEPADVILLDLNFSRAQMSGEEGLLCLQNLRRHDPDAAVLIVTGHSGLNVAVQALRAGAHNFIMKPWNNERLLAAIEEAASQRGAIKIDREADDAASEDAGLIIGECDALTRIKELITRYARLTAPVLLVGENGTGKSMLANVLHRHSGRSSLKVLEADRLDMADLLGLTDTTVVLENIDQLDAANSLPLSTWLQNAGSLNTRVVATTCRRRHDLTIQRSLLYALSTLEITLPPLADRGNDLELLSNHFARVFAIKQGLGPRSLAPEAIVGLRAFPWPDNLHALRRIIERAVAESDGPIISFSDLDLSSATSTETSSGLNLERSEKYAIEEALSRHNFNISKAAVELGVTRQTLYRRMARHGL
ncbi:response regulator [Asticcacaulis sp. SL142]|uniref:sigma-54-dependent transcriptional regulator n=1 Tax=Asticcacaulis sp. SL142 TaxID=2995155 RepID=UPI00226C6C0D|nr:response regulator [Asticcacaulis sp. SL142]WAC46854.1 response regulator [Asticcacaulis sp. SL142]